MPRQIKRYRVYENSINTLIETDDLTEAKNIQIIAHAKATDRYDEIWEKQPDGQIWGKSQFEPDDCWKCGRQLSRCECKNLGYTITRLDN